MVALLEQVWPGLVDALLQECGRPSQHMWMIMGCLRTIIQVLGVQVHLKKSLCKMPKAEAVQADVYVCSHLCYMQFMRKLQVALAMFAIYQIHGASDFCAVTQASYT